MISPCEARVTGAGRLFRALISTVLRHLSDGEGAVWTWGWSNRPPQEPVFVSLDHAASQEDPVFAFNPDAKVRVERIGQEANPVVVIDDVIARPEALAEFGARRSRFVPAAKYRNMYPGLLDGLLLPYVSALVLALHPIIVEAFGLEGPTKPDNARCNLCLVTQRPEQLGVMQRLPHVDTLDPTQFAILHYLCDERFGGTAFYRHRTTAFESLDVQRDPPSTSGP